LESFILTEEKLKIEIKKKKNNVDDEPLPDPKESIKKRDLEIVLFTCSRDILNWLDDDKF